MYYKRSNVEYELKSKFVLFGFNTVKRIKIYILILVLKFKINQQLYFYHFIQECVLKFNWVNVYSKNTISQQNKCLLLCCTIVYRVTVKYSVNDNKSNWIGTNDFVLCVLF